MAELGWNNGAKIKSVSVPKVDPGKKPRVSIVIELADAEKKTVFWDRYLSPAAKEYTAETLTAMGYDPSKDNWAGLFDFCSGADCKAVGMEVGVNLGVRTGSDGKEYDDVLGVSFKSNRPQMAPDERAALIASLSGAAPPPQSSGPAPVDDDDTPF